VSERGVWRVGGRGGGRWEGRGGKGREREIAREERDNGRGAREGGLV